MSLEVATYVNDLQPVNPPSTDPTNQGDDHLRLIKQVLQNQFKNASRQGAIPTTSVISATGSVAQTLDGGTILVSTASGAVTLTLPGLAAGDAGWTCYLLKTSTDVNPVLIKPVAGNIVSGQYTVTQARRCIPGIISKIIWTGASWYITRVTGLPIGAIVEFWGTSIPTGYEWPNGQTLATVATNYPEYTAVYGSGATPDLRGYTSICLDNLGGAAAGRLPNGFISGSTLGAVGGVDGAGLVTANIPAHAHNVYFGDPGHTHNFINNGTAMAGVYTDQSQCFQYLQSGGQGCQSYYTTIQSSGTGCYIGSAPGTNNSTTTSVGSGSIVSHLQPSIMMAKIMVVE